MGGKLDGKKKLILFAVLALVVVIGIVLIATSKPSAPEPSSDAYAAMASILFTDDYDDAEPYYSSDFYFGTDSYGFSTDSYSSGSSECFWCDDTGKCPECRRLKDCQYKYGASHPCVNGKIYYGGKTIPCSACGGTGDCDKCDGTGRCPYCR